MAPDVTRLLRALMAAVALEMVILVVLAWPTWLLAGGPPGAAALLGLLALAGLVPVVVLVAVLHRRMGLLRHDLVQRDEHLARLAAATHDWWWEATPELVITASSPGGTRLLGYPVEEVLGRSLLDLVDADDLDRARQLLAEAVRTGTGWSDVHLRWRHREGHPVAIEQSAVAVLDRLGRLTGYRGTGRAVPTESVSMRRLAAIVHRTRAAVTEGSIGVALQPIADAAAGRLAGAEALAAFPDNRPPDEWFAEAHEAAVGVELELATLQAAVAVVPQLPAPAYLSVNASPALVLDPAFRALLERAEPWLDRLVIEITEHAAVSRYDDIRAALMPLRERGVRLAVDDTGAGYASFNHVLRLRPDIIKLDRSLLHGIHDDPARRAVVTAVVLMGLELDASVTGEGVETVEELQMLRSLGVDAVQGYLLARPNSDPHTWSTWGSRDWLRHAGLPPRPTAAQLRDTRLQSSH